MQTKIKHKVGQVKLSRKDMINYVRDHAIFEVKEKMSAINKGGFAWDLLPVSVPSRFKTLLKELRKFDNSVSTRLMYVRVTARDYDYHSSSVKDYPVILDDCPNLVADLVVHRTKHQFGHFGKMEISLPAQKGDFNDKDLETLKSEYEYVKLHIQWTMLDKTMQHNCFTNYDKLLTNVLMSADKDRPVTEVLNEIVDKLASEDYKSFIEENC